MPDTFSISLDSMDLATHHLFDVDSHEVAIKWAQMLAWRSLNQEVPDTGKALLALSRAAMRLQYLEEDDSAFTVMGQLGPLEPYMKWCKAEGKSGILRNIGSFLRKRSELDLALSCLRYADEIDSRSESLKTQRGSALALTMLYLETGDTTAALKAVRRAWSIARTEAGPMPSKDFLPVLEDVSRNMAITFMNYGPKYSDSAQYYFDLGIGYSNAYAGPNSYDHSVSLLNKALSFDDHSPPKPDSTIKYCMAGLRAMPANHPGRASITQQYIEPALGFAYASLCDSTSALHYANFDSSAAPYDWSGSGDPRSELYRSDYNASIYQQLFECTGVRKFGLFAARIHEQTRQGALSLMDEVDPATAIKALETNNTQNAHYLNLLYKLGGSEETSLEKIAELMEERKSMSLQRFAQMCAATDPVSQSNLYRLRELSRKIDQNDLDQPSSIRLAWSREADSLRTAVLASAQIKSYQGAKQVLATMRSIATGGTTLLTYAVVDSLIYVLCVQPDTAFFKRLTLNADQKRVLLKLPETISTNGPSTKQDLTLAGELLFSSIQITPTKQTIILPEGMLDRIPFDALIVKVPGSSPKLLGDLTVVKTAHAIGLINKPNSSNSEGQIRAVAPNFQPFNASKGSLLQKNPNDKRDAAIYERLTPLRYNTEEVNALLDKFQGELFGINSSTGDEVVLGRSASGDVIHFATHAMTDPKDPELSAIVLADPFMDQGNMEQALAGPNRALLHAYTIKSRPINASMVVLSACETGVGKEVAGEGSMSLARAFSYAGVPNIVSSLWKVDDLATKQIMVKFYEKLAEGMGKADALAEAKRWYRKEYPDEPPSKWAAFILIGDNEPVHLKKRTKWWPWVVGGVLLLAGAVVWQRKRRAV